MLTKISALQAHAKPIKYAKNLPHISQQICAISQLNSHRQISALRSVVTDILTKISHDNSIISKINKSNSLINLSENEIGFLDSQKNEIRFSIPKEHNKSLFGIQLIKNNEPTFSVFLDAFGKLIENYTSPELKYIYSDNVDLNILEKEFSEIYTSSDDLLFGLRLNVNNASTREILNLNKINIPSLEHLEYKKPIIGYHPLTGDPIFEGEVIPEVREPNQPLTEEEKTRLSNTILIITGALLIVLASIIFLATGWETIDGIFKTLILFGIQMIFSVLCLMLCLASCSYYEAPGDFSGGMDIVLGASQMLGLKLSENFDVPYLSESI